jgi:hypothetical protein
MMELRLTPYGNNMKTIEKVTKFVAGEDIDIAKGILASSLLEKLGLFTLSAVMSMVVPNLSEPNNKPVRVENHMDNLSALL